jgi:hypothetical protein
MAAIRTLIEPLCSVLLDSEHRERWVKEFQDLAWNLPRLEPQGAEWDLLVDLAYDLDYYEPNPRLRREDPTFFGDEWLEDEVRTCLTKLRQLGVPLPPRAHLALDEVEEDPES